MWPQEFAINASNHLHKDASDLPSQMVSLPSTDALVRVMELAYLASLLPEESEYLPFRIIVPVQKSQELLSSLDPPIKIEDPRTLRKILSIAPSPNFALVIEPSEGDINSLGVTRVDRMRYGRFPRIGPNFMYSSGGMVAIHIRCPGPGIIQVSLTSKDVHEFSSGISQVHRSRSVNAVREVLEWYDGITARISEAYLHKCPEGWVREFWTRILDATVERGHGAMFAIVNDNDSNLHEKLRSQCRVRLNLDLFAILIKPLTEAIEASDLQSTDFNTLSGQIVAEEDLLATIDWIVGLSSMDGAVLLDRNLKLYGAGMEVSYANSKEGPDVLLIDASGGTKSYSWIMQNFGMRHRAACRCAAEHDNSIIFVISQDGDLTVFAQSSGQVRVIQGLKPIFWSGLH